MDKDDQDWKLKFAHGWRPPQTSQPPVNHHTYFPLLIYLEIR